MRGIKFRVLDYNGQMVFSDKHYEGDLGMFFEQMSPDGEDVMQYTGLKDKNGVEIYEGDVLAQENYAPNKVVRWNEKTAGFNIRSRGYRNALYPVEVIGNIYENPELLEANQ